METSEINRTTGLPDAPDLSALSNEELIAKINELEARIEELTNPPPNDWHSWFYILLNIALHRFRKDNVKVLREVVLGAMPPRADFVVVEEDDVIDLGLAVFSFFRKYNILEFKSPDDELSESVLWKAVGYTGFFISHYKAPAKAITLTLIRGAKPVKLFKKLGGCVKADAVKGIYHIGNWKVDFPIQVVVTAELEGKEYAAFRTISKKPSLDDIQLIMGTAEKEADPEMKALLREFLEMLSRLDSEALEEAKRREPDMARTWRDIFGVNEEINTAVNTAVENDRRTNLYVYVQDGDMMLENAARRAGITTDQFRSEMASHGYNVPQAV
ncbi:MAG: hypothetical protein IJU50_07550 [Lachnospiraceae bacterium]|nr:hypothetical protein [Lachnospiraceae bacterium]